MRFTSGSASLGLSECSMWESERPNDSCSLKRSEMKEWNKCGELQLIFLLKKIISSSFLSRRRFLFFFSPLSFFPLSQFWHAMTVTVVYKSPFPWTVSACLFWNETTAIRSSAVQIPGLFCSTLLPNPPTPNNRTLLWCCTDISNHLVCFQAKYR